MGNSTHWIVLGGVGILTDPWISEPADRVLRHRRDPRPLPASPDVVLITHGHGDHFDPVALQRLDRRAAVVVPAGRLARAVSVLGFSDVRAVSAGDVLEVRGVAIDVVRGRHSVPELCYRVERAGTGAFFFGGDTRLTPEIETLADRKPVPLAILPGERSSLLGWRFVMTPPEAVRLARRFRAVRAVLTHHEQQVVSRWPYGWLVHVPPPDPAEFPEWFSIPTPGDFIPFPWAAAETESDEATPATDTRQGAQ